MNLETILKAMQYIGPVTSAISEVRSVIDVGIALLHPKDQATAKEALADLQADNDEGHQRLQDKLREAAGR